MDNTQYLSKETLFKKIPEIKINVSDLGTTDTYHEERLLNKFLSLDKLGQTLVYKAALQLSIIGFGNKNYGFVRIDDKNIITLEEIFTKYNVAYKNKQNVKLNDDDLSARRLMRLFRYQTQKFIIENKRPSYLWMKYAEKSNQDYVNICFPGGEHLVETKDEAIFFLNTYRLLDEIYNAKFRLRLQRVFIARKILDPSFFTDKQYQ